jgi:hypothetical protein
VAARKLRAFYVLRVKPRATLCCFFRLGALSDGVTMQSAEKSNGAVLHTVYSHEQTSRYFSDLDDELALCMC